MVATSNTGLKGAFGLSIQNTSCLAARREVWSRLLGANEHRTYQNRPLDHVSDLIRFVFELCLKHRTRMLAAA